jgi:hypothetical protein
VGDAYRPDPTVEGAQARRIWRPWMTRLAVLFGCVASPVTSAGVIAWCETRYHGPQEPAWVILTTATIVTHSLLGIIGCSSLAATRDLTASLAIRLAWAGLYYPILGVIRTCCWVARGE